MSAPRGFVELLVRHFERAEPMRILVRPRDIRDVAQVAPGETAVQRYHAPAPLDVIEPYDRVVAKLCEVMDACPFCGMSCRDYDPEAKP